MRESSNQPSANPRHCPGRKEPIGSERAWLGALDKGLQKSGLTMPANVNVIFPYYADALDKFVAEFDMPTGDRVAAKGGAMDNEYAQFRAQMAEDIRRGPRFRSSKSRMRRGPRWLRRRVPRTGNGCWPRYAS